MKFTSSGINLEMDTLDILNKHIKLPEESPVAAYLRATANLSLAGISCRKEVFFRAMIGDTTFSKYSKSVGVIKPSRTTASFLIFLSL
jgi:hypothetical protein